MATPSSSPPTHPKPSKRLIVCCDGTWVAGDHAKKGDSSYQTNITRMCHALADDGKTKEGRMIPQIIYYQSGVGSGAPTALGRMIAGAVGFGVNENILSAYNFLVNNYSPGDELFFFGFSRGSFTCRSLAGMISKLGILKQEEAGEYFAGIWDRYQNANPAWDPTDKKRAWDVKIKVIGCWDTVGSLGIPEGPITSFLNLNREHAFHDTGLSDKVENAFHALALDEYRRSFSPTLWYLTPEQIRNDPDRRTHLKQCWFPGVHTDVGRGYDDHVPNDIADITFAWMVDQCNGLLDFNEPKLLMMLKGGDHKIPIGAEAESAWDDKVLRARRWGLAYLHDSMTPVFWLGGPATRTPGQYIFVPRGAIGEKTDSSSGGSGFVTKSKIIPDAKPETKPWHSRLFGAAVGVFTGPPADIAQFDEVWTSEAIHPSVRLRRMQDPDYDPPALKDFDLTYDETHNRWTWVRKWTDNGKVREKRLHEYQIPEKSLSIRKVTADVLKLGVDRKEPLPPRQPGWWASLWRG